MIVGVIVGVIETVIEGGGRVTVRLPDGKTREYGLSRGRRMLERPKVGMAIGQYGNGHLRFFASKEEAERIIKLEALS